MVTNEHYLRFSDDVGIPLILLISLNFKITIKNYISR